MKLRGPSAKIEKARDLRRKMTPAEEKLWRALRYQKTGFKFRRQHQFGDYLTDFYCRDACLVIECDGSVHERNERWHHDRNRDACMIGQGVRVLRFTNDQVLNETEIVLGEIARHLPLPFGRGPG